MIPKIIFQTWKTHEVPEKYKLCVESVKAQHPDYKYVLFSDEDNEKFVKEYFPSFYPVWKSFPYPIQRADTVRYMFLYIYGGLYFDLDYYLKTPLTPYLDQNDSNIYFIIDNEDKLTICNALMASVPRHPFWLELLENITKYESVPNYEHHRYVVNTTGPLMVQRVLDAAKYDFNLIPPYYYHRCSYICNNDTCMELVEGTSWSDVPADYLKYCGDYAWIIALFAFLIIISFFLSS